MNLEAFEHHQLKIDSVILATVPSPCLARVNSALRTRRSGNFTNFYGLQINKLTNIVLFDKKLFTAALMPLIFSHSRNGVLDTTPSRRHIVSAAEDASYGHY